VGRLQYRRPKDNEKKEKAIYTHLDTVRKRWKRKIRTKKKQMKAKATIEEVWCHVSNHFQDSQYKLDYVILLEHPKINWTVSQIQLFNYVNENFPDFVERITDEKTFEETFHELVVENRTYADLHSFCYYGEKEYYSS
jgi:hypothetical protein